MSNCAQRKGTQLKRLTNRTPFTNPTTITVQLLHIGKKSCNTSILFVEIFILQSCNNCILCPYY